MRQFEPTTGNVARLGCGAFLLIFALHIAQSLLVGWVLTFVLGALHDAIPSVPALGYWPCVGICFLLGVLFNMGRLQIRKSRS